MGITIPGESREYRAARDRLLEREIELRRTMEAVAAARRELPPGGRVMTDYVFQGAGVDGSPSDVRLSQLFEPGKDSLLIYSFMFPRDPDDQTPGPVGGETERLPLAEGPCPSCTALLDQLDGAAGHRPACKPCGRRQGAPTAGSGVRTRAWVASAATPVLSG